MHNFGVKILKVLKNVKKCVYLCITAINFAEVSAWSGMFRHLGFSNFNSKIVRSKNTKDRECQKTTKELYEASIIIEIVLLMLLLIIIIINSNS